MTKEFSYTRIEYPATEKVGGAPVNPNVGVVAELKSGEEEATEASKEIPVVIPESFFEALKREKPDGINWDRVDLAVAVLKGEKDAVTPKPPELEPTESQKFWRDMYRTGKLSPYQKDRPAVEWSALVDFGKKYIGHPIAFYTKSGNDIMELDMRLRGGADKEYNQLGDMSKRATRMGVMALNTVPAITMDIVTSIPPNLLQTAIDVHFKNQLKAARADLEKDKNNSEKQKLVNKLVPISSVLKTAGKIGEVMNDKNVTAAGDWWVKKLTGEKTGWFTGESSDKLNDLLTYGFGDKIEDFVNGPTIESLFRIIYEVPVLGALVEQVWTRWTLFQSKTAFHKGNLKAVYAGIGIGIGILRDTENKVPHTPSWSITEKIWNRYSTHKIGKEANTAE